MAKGRETQRAQSKQTIKRKSKKIPNFKAKNSKSKGHISVKENQLKITLNRRCLHRYSTSQGGWKNGNKKSA